MPPVCDKASGSRRTGTGGTINTGKDFSDDSKQLTGDVKSGSRFLSQHIYPGRKKTSYFKGEISLKFSSICKRENHCYTLGLSKLQKIRI